MFDDDNRHYVDIQQIVAGLHASQVTNEPSEYGPYTRREQILPNEIMGSTHISTSLHRSGFAGLGEHNVHEPAITISRNYCFSNDAIVCLASMNERLVEGAHG